MNWYQDFLNGKPTPLPFNAEDAIPSRALLHVDVTALRKLSLHDRHDFLNYVAGFVPIAGVRAVSFVTDGILFTIYDQDADGCYYVDHSSGTAGTLVQYFQVDVPTFILEIAYRADRDRTRRKRARPFIERAKTRQTAS